MERNKSIDFLKLISIFFVVTIHIPFNGRFGFIIGAINRFSVPIFFMITGYFIAKSRDIQLSIKHQILKMLKYYIIYELIFIAYEFFIALPKMNFSIFKENLLTDVKYILIAPTIGTHLWYIINIIWVLMIIYIFNKIHKFKILAISSGVIYLFGVIISNLSQQIFNLDLPLYTTRNFLFFGLFYVIIGMKIAKIDIYKIKINNNLILFASVIFCFSQVIEKYLWKSLYSSNFGEYFITTIFASILMFIYALRTNVSNKFFNKISSYSMPIFFLHPLALRILRLLWAYIFKSDINLVTNTKIGNSIFILIVCVFSCLLYDSFKMVKTSISNKSADSINLTN